MKAMKATPAAPRRKAEETAAPIGTDLHEEERFSAEVAVRTMANLREWVDQNQKRISWETAKFRSRLVRNSVLVLLLLVPALAYVLAVERSMRADFATQVASLKQESATREEGRDQALAKEQAEMDQLRGQLAAAESANKEMLTAVASTRDSQTQLASLKDQLANAVQSAKAGQAQIDSLFASAQAAHSRIEAFDAFASQEQAKWASLYQAAEAATQKLGDMRKWIGPPLQGEQQPSGKKD
jgi:hypothetical protein